MMVISMATPMVRRRSGLPDVQAVASINFSEDLQRSLTPVIVPERLYLL